MMSYLMLASQRPDTGGKHIRGIPGQRQRGSTCSDARKYGRLPAQSLILDRVYLNQNVVSSACLLRPAAPWPISRSWHSPHPVLDAPPRPVSSRTSRTYISLQLASYGARAQPLSSPSTHQLGIARHRPRTRRHLQHPARGAAASSPLWTLNITLISKSEPAQSGRQPWSRSCCWAHARCCRALRAAMRI